LETLTETFRKKYNDNTSHKKTWGGGIMGTKAQHVIAKKEKLIQEEIAKKTNV
jgi:large subunit ribosomal protein L7Ae